MKDIHEYIIERFRISSKTVNKVNKNLVKDILEHFSLNEDDSWNEYIENWIVKNDVQNVYYVGDPETLEEGKDAGMPENIIKDFDTNIELIEKCQEELEKCKSVFDPDNPGLTMEFSDKMIAYLSSTGGLYVWKN
jgi:hypothetical protein